MEESGTRKVEIPASDNDFAISLPEYLCNQAGERVSIDLVDATNEGAVSATITV